MPDDRNTAGKNQESQANTSPPLHPTDAQSAPNPNEPHADNVQNQTRNNPQISEKWFRNPDWHMVWLTGALFGVGVVTLYFFYGQFGEMQKQTGILSEQAEDASADARMASRHARQQLRAAQAQVEAIQRQMRQDQRAWISSTTETAGVPGIPAIGQPFLIRTAFKNIGKSAALHLRTCTVSEFLPKEKLPDFKCPSEIKHFVSVGTLFPGSSIFNDLVTSTAIKATDRDKILSNNWNMWVYGRVEYTDVFDVPHWFNFCTHLLSGGGYAVCDKHTETDENY